MGMKITKTVTDKDNDNNENQQPSWLVSARQHQHIMMYIADIRQEFMVYIRFLNWIYICVLLTTCY